MCVVSVVSDWASTTVPVTTWTTSNWGEYQEIIRRLEELDRKLGFANCEDPAKQAWMENVEKRLKKLERKAAKGHRTPQIK